MSEAFFRFACPQCSQRLKTPVNAVGAVIPCPKCKAKLVVPTVPSDPGILMVAQLASDDKSLNVHSDRTRPVRAAEPAVAKPDRRNNLAIPAAVGAASIFLTALVCYFLFAPGKDSYKASPQAGVAPQSLAEKKTPAKPVPPPETLPQQVAPVAKPVVPTPVVEPKVPDEQSNLDLLTKLFPGKLPSQEPAPKIETTDPIAKKTVKEPIPVRQPPLEITEEHLRRFVEDPKFTRFRTEVKAFKNPKLAYHVRRLKLPESFQSRPLKLGVSQANYDNIAAVLQKLGIPFENIFWAGADWQADRLEPYDVIFLNCGGTVGSPNEQQAIRKYVEKGGTLYASDLQYTSVRPTFLGSTPNPHPFSGQVQKLKARVVDSTLRVFLEANEIELSFNSSGWKAANFEIDRAETYLTGEPRGANAGPVAAGFNPVMPPMDPNAATTKPGPVKSPTLDNPTIIQGSLTTKDPKYAKIGNYKAFTVKLAKGVRYQFDLMPTDFNGFLGLLTKQGAMFLKSDDFIPGMANPFLKNDGGVSGNVGARARLVFTSPKDEEFKVVAATQDSRLGHFALQITEMNEPKVESDPSIPLLTKFPFGAGRVIFTSFHNSAQTKALEKKLLEFLVFSAVTARAESKVTEIMKTLNFQPQDMRTLYVSAGSTTAAQTITHTGGALQVAVAFEHLGATLKLTLISPTGEKMTHVEAGMFVVEIPNAVNGNWEFQVTGITVPFTNFPFALGAGRGLAVPTPVDLK